MRMAPLPAALGGSALVAWRLDREIYRETWNSGEGAYRVGGRWSGPGIRAVYCALDPAASILEVAVHAGFRMLDTVPHVMTEIEVDPEEVRILHPDQIANPNWLRPGLPSRNQQVFGADLLRQHRFVVVPSVAAPGSWNLLFTGGGTGPQGYAVRSQERFALDPRLQPPHPA